MVLVMDSACVQVWLEDSGLGRHKEAFSGVGEAAFRALLMQDYSKYGVTSMDDKQALFRLIKRVNSTSFPAPRQPKPEVDDLLHERVFEGSQAAAASVEQSSGAFDGNATLNLLDLNDHDGDLLSLPNGCNAVNGTCGNDVSPRTDGGLLGPPSSRPQYIQEVPAPQRALPVLGQAGDPPKIRVVVRKRPLNSKEMAKSDPDIVDVTSLTSLQVNETKTKVDLAKYVECHQFAFDDALDENVSNDDVYRCTVQPLVATLFRGGKATCFAYGQTGSGKTYTMSPLPIRAGADILQELSRPEHTHLELWVSNYEIYGGKLFDLLNARKKLVVREDGRQQVCIVGLQEHKVDGAKMISQLIDHGAGARVVGCTGANDESSRSHSIVQFAVKRPSKKGDTMVVAGKLSFIDLAGSERGADTYHNDRTTRLEGAEINKSLLALKECIRALDMDKSHVPFRGSKLTEVLRDSFVGKEARTVMIANISPNSASVEHTLNTLRYADRVKELRKEVKNRAPGGVTPGVAGYGRDNARPSSAPSSGRQHQQRPLSAAMSPIKERSSPGKGFPGSNAITGAAGVVVDTRQSPSPSDSPVTVPANDDEEINEQDCLMTHRDELVSSILQMEDDLIAAHRAQIEETMELVRKEMNLLAEVDQPGSQIDLYVAQLAPILEQKAARTESLRQQLAEFQRKLKEEEELSKSFGEGRRLNF